MATALPATLPKVLRAKKPGAVFAMDPAAVNLVYGPTEQERLARLLEVSSVVVTPENWRSHRAELAEAEFLLSGWKAPVFDEEFLAACPRLRMVLYAAGSIRYCTPPEFWKSGVLISNAAAANAVPVAEYTLSVCLLALKQFWRTASLARRGQGWGDHTRPIRGSFRARVGLVSFGRIARMTSELLQRHDIEVMVQCPFLSNEEAERHGVLLGDLDEVFRTCNVVSIHTPLLPETVGYIRGRHVRLMQQDAALINTARGPVLDQMSVIGALRDRSDVTAILDVTDPEPPKADDLLFSLPNVVVTPHIAGSHGVECERLGAFMVDELERHLAGQTLKWVVTREMAARMA